MTGPSGRIAEFHLCNNAVSNDWCSWLSTSLWSLSSFPVSRLTWLMYGQWELKVISLLNTSLTFPVPFMRIFNTFMMCMRSHTHKKLSLWSLSHLISCRRSQTNYDLPCQLKSVCAYMSAQVCQQMPVMSVGQCHYNPLLTSAKMDRPEISIGACVFVLVCPLQNVNAKGKRAFLMKWCHRGCFTHTLLRTLQAGGRRRGLGRSGQQSPGWWGWHPAGPPIPAAGRFLASLEVSGFYHIVLFSCLGQFGHRQDLRGKRPRGRKRNRGKVRLHLHTMIMSVWRKFLLTFWEFTLHLQTTNYFYC